jgi:hypothetical protein
VETYIYLLGLDYVIRKDKQPPYAETDEERMYRMSLRGQTFQLDNAKVFGILTELLANSVAWTWISKYEPTKNGRAAMAALRTHYADGPGETRRRVPEAQNILTELRYVSESRFTFEQYITKLSEAFEVLHEHGFGKSEPEKVFILLAGITCENQISYYCCNYCCAYESGTE